MDRLDPIEPTEKDAPLRYDIRLLGRILGDTVRAQEGDEVFELVERIRRTGVQFHRNDDEAARQELQTIMSGLPTDQALSIIRAFSYFSHLANIAEDQHHIRRTRAHAMAEAPPRRGHHGLCPGPRPPGGRLTREQLQGFFDHALCSPVLTAHPTEVRRKSSIDREMEIARLLDERDRVEFTPEELARQPTRRCAAPCSRCGRPACCAARGCASSTRSRTALVLLRLHLPARAAALLRRPRGPARRRRPGLAGRRGAVRSCAWAAGSAATATAIPSSPPR